MSWNGASNASSTMAIMSWAGGSVGFSIVRDFVASRTPPGQLRKCQELLAEVDELLGELTDEERTRMALLNPEFMSRLSEDIHTYVYVIHLNINLC